MIKTKIWGIVKVVGPIVIILAAFAGGMLFQANNQLVEASSTAEASIDLSSFWKVWDLVNKDFVSTGATSSVSVKVGDKEKVYGAIQGMLDSLGDPYSVFLTPDENKMFTEEISGNFGGIGIEIGVRDSILTVISALPNTPAKKAGIEAGDKIVAINDESTVKINVVEAVKIIRGKIGTAVTLSIIRGKEDKPRVFKLVRDNIQVPTIETKALPGGITQIKLFNFGATASDQFAAALQAFVKSGNKYLIVDLRGNPGGYLDSAIEISSWFLPKGAPVVIEERGHGFAPKTYTSSGAVMFKTKPKVVVLVDEGSASASEIVAGALRENGVAKLVGEQTFGKGSVQELFPITKDTSLKLTIAKWLTPHGVSISQNGLKPDFEVAAASSTDSKLDPQLDKAISVVKSLK